MLFRSRKPTVVAAVTLTAGFLVARFIKASAEGLRNEQAAQRAGRGAGGRQGSVRQGAARQGGAQQAGTPQGSGPRAGSGV